jgi:hypothetical protein
MAAQREAGIPAIGTWAIAQEEARGFDVKSGRVEGYDGWSCGKAFWGQREDGFMLRVTSSFADTVCNQFPRVMPYATRLDCQITVNARPDAQSEMAFVWGAADSHNKARPKAQQFSLERWTDPDSLGTTYVGSRTTEHFGRIYDKGRESQEEYYSDCVRYEVEFKRRLASAMGRNLLSTPMPTWVSVIPYVSEWFGKRGIVIGVEGVQALFELPRLEVAKTEDVTSLKWLREQVQPTVRRLISHIDRSIIEACLGLREASGDMDYIPEEGGD